MKTDDVVVVIRHTALPGKGSIARRELGALIARVLATEAGCREIVFHQDPQDDTKFLLYERWDSAASYTGPHRQTPHMLDFVQRARDFLILPPDITFWQAGAP